MRRRSAWAGTWLTRFRSQGATEYIECGPGRVLTGRIRRIDREAALHNIHDLPSLDKVVSALKGGG